MLFRSGREASTKRTHASAGLVHAPAFSAAESGAGHGAGRRCSKRSAEGAACVASLPQELAAAFLAYLDPASLASAEAVCRGWKRHVDALGWERFARAGSLRRLMHLQRTDLTAKHHSIRAQRAVDGRAPGTILIIGGTRNRPMPSQTYFGFVDDAGRLTQRKFISQVDLPVHLCAFGTAAVSEGGVCIVGGWTDTTALASTTFLNPFTLQLYRGPEMNRQRCFLSACSLSTGAIVATGGASSLWQGATVESSIEILSTDRGHWVEGPSMLHPRAGHGSVSHPDGHIYVFGGYGGEMEYHHNAECFDPVIGEWREIAPMASRRTGLGATIGADMCIYAIGGSPNGSGGYNTAERYDPRVGKWEWLPILDQKRGYCAAASGAGHEVYVSGGVHLDNFAQGIEVFDIRAHRWFMQPGSNTRTVKRADHGMVMLL